MAYHTTRLMIRAWVIQLLSLQPILLCGQQFRTMILDSVIETVLLSSLTMGASSYSIALPTGLIEADAKKNGL